MVIIESKRKKLENILKQHPNAIIADVTSHATDDLVKNSILFIRIEIYPCHLARDYKRITPLGRGFKIRDTFCMSLSDFVVDR